MLVCRSMRVCVTRSIRCFVHCYSSVYALNCRTRKISVCWTGEKCVSTNKQGSKAQQSNKAKAKRMRKNKLFIQIHKLFPLLRSRVDFDRGNVLLLFLWFDCFFFCVHVIIQSIFYETVVCAVVSIFRSARYSFSLKKIRTKRNWTKLNRKGIAPF